MKNQLFFNGGGVCGGPYHLGSMEALREANVTIDRVYGISVGSILGLYYILGISREQALNLFFSGSDNMKHVFDGAGVAMSALLILDEFDEPELLKLTNDRLHVGITLASGFIFKSKFTSKHDLYNAIMCSIHIPGFSQYRAEINGEPCIDGGMNGTKYIKQKYNLFPDTTYESHPQIKMPICLLRPPRFTVDWIFEDGKSRMCSQIVGEPASHGIWRSIATFVSSIAPSDPAINTEIIARCDNKGSKRS